MENDVSAEGWMLRAAACELLAFSLRYPDAELAAALASGEWADAAEEVAAALGLSLPEGFAADARACAGKGAGLAGAVDAPTADAGGCPEDSESLLHGLRAEATRLFVGAPEPAVSPYEGVWRAADDGVQALLFVNPHSMAVERFCRSCGLGRPEGTNEPLDHAATELELLQHLASLAAAHAASADAASAADVAASDARDDEAAASALEPDSAVAAEPTDATAELPGGSAAAAYEQFLREHALTWMPRFAEAVVTETRVPFYRATVALLDTFLSSEH